MSEQPCYPNPLTAYRLAHARSGFGELGAAGSHLYLSERRPDQGGRMALMRTEQGDHVEPQTGVWTQTLPPPSNVGSRVHTYGGGGFSVAQETIYFVEASDGDLYAHASHGPSDQPPRNLTHQAKCRYALPDFNPHHRMLYAVEEDFTSCPLGVRRLVAIDPSSGTHTPSILHEGADFYGGFSCNDAGDRLAFICWNYPHMPWDSSELWVGVLPSPTSPLTDLKQVAGGATESVQEPRWGPDGKLYFLSDRSNWWNLYRRSDDGTLDLLFPREADLGTPPWILGNPRYTFLDTHTLVVIATTNGTETLLRADLLTRAVQELEQLPFCHYSHLTTVGHTLACFAAGEKRLPALLTLSADLTRFTVVKESAPPCIPESMITTPQTIVMPTREQTKRYAFYYPPQVDMPHSPPPLPPLIVRSHSGPTHRVSAALNYEVQFWTSRGFAVLEVNYRGSSGYGRAYRQALAGQWGVVDVEDCLAMTRHLIDQGVVDPDKVAIRGSSSGGFTALLALMNGSTFKAGVSYYGVSDLQRFTQATHAFELGYFDHLIGPYPAMETRYLARNPIVQAQEKLCSPLLLIQGEQDPVVPKEQTERLHAVAKERQVPVAALFLPGAGHGLTDPADRQLALETELAFYVKVLQLEGYLGCIPFPTEVTLDHFDRL